MRLVPQCLGPEELGIALRLTRVLHFMGTFADLNAAPAFDAYRLLAPCLRELGAERGSPYVGGLTRYLPGEGRPMHVDPAPIPSLEHHRIVVVLHRARRGGDLRMGDVALHLFPGDGVVFRADTTMHGVEPVTEGLRLGLTVGVLL